MKLKTAAGKQEIIPHLGSCCIGNLAQKWGKKVKFLLSEFDGKLIFRDDLYVLDVNDCSVFEVGN